MNQQQNEMVEEEIEDDDDEDSDVEEESQSEPDIEIPLAIKENELRNIKASPIKYIGDWMEGNLLHVGKRVFRFLSLLPCSLIIPSITFNSTDIRANFNVMILGSPSSGKSTISKKMARLSYFPIEIRSIKSKKLMNKINKSRDLFTIIVEDFSQLVQDSEGYEKVKILEGALGDEKTISYENMKYGFRGRTQGAGVFCGTWIDLKKYQQHLKGGLLSRAVLIFVSLKRKQREEIGDFINLGIGNRKSAVDSKIKEQIVKDFYKELLSIQTGKHPQVKKIVTYEFDDIQKSRVLTIWKGLIKDFANDTNGDFKRELHDFYRFAVSSAFINIFNGRTANDGILKPTKEDYDFALELMTEALKNKLALIESEGINKNIKTPAQFVALMNNPLREDIKNIFQNLSPFGHMVQNGAKPQVEQKK